MTRMRDAAIAAPPVLVRRSTVVKASAAHAFAVFTERFGSWWPVDSHHIGEAAAATAIIEPRVGGRWFERGVDGSECDWGRVLAWQPPTRLLLQWQLDAEFAYDPKLHTEVEVRFVAEAPDRTRVEIEHRLLERYGEQTERMRTAFDSERGWSGMLSCFARATAAG